jgi:hypothetical protein
MLIASVHRLVALIKVHNLDSDMSLEYWLGQCNQQAAPPDVAQWGLVAANAATFGKERKLVALSDAQQCARSPTLSPTLSPP